MATTTTSLKAKRTEVMRLNPVHSVFNAFDKAVHRRKRKVVGQGFSESALRASQGQILSHVEDFCGRLLEGETRGGSTEPKDLSLWGNYVTMDVI
jgi:cytochrome P450